MTKNEMRKAINEGLKLYFASGKTITKCPEAVMQVKRRSLNKKNDTIEIDTSKLPTALKIRFGFTKE